MALEQYAFLARENVPSVIAWQAAVMEIGFDLQISPSLKPFEDSGFVPCKLGQVDTGFEIYYEAADEVLGTYPQISEKIAPRDYVISFRWGHDMAECACVLIASAALAKSFDAVIYYPDDDLIYTVDDLIADAGQAFAEIDNLPKEDNTELSLSDHPAMGKRWWEFWK